MGKTLYQEIAEQIEMGCYESASCCGQERCYCESSRFELVRCAEIVKERMDIAASDLQQRNVALVAALDIIAAKLCVKEPDNVGEKRANNCILIARTALAANGGGDE